MIISGDNITMTRGDYDNFNVDVENVRHLIDFEAGDKIYWTVKKNKYSDEPLIQKIITNYESDMVLIEIEHEDTRDMAYNTYVYDVRIFKDNKPYKTIIKESNFTLTGEISYG